MPKQATVYVGTVGQGVWRSMDGGETWERVHDQLYSESDIRAIAVHPRDPRILYAGTDTGVYRSSDGGDTWSRSDSEMNELHVWSLAIDPAHPETVYAGTRPSAVYRSEDDGGSWQKLDTGMETVCPPILYTRVTTLLCDPVDTDTLWAGVEIDGVYRSKDRGATWTAHKTGLNSLDIHGITILPGPPKRILVTTNAGICISTDNGETFQDMEIHTRFAWRYCRGTTQKTDGSGVIFVGNGSGPPGDAGAIRRTTDGGLTWGTPRLSHEPNSTIWHFAVNPLDPDLLFAYSVSGQVFRSDDGGENWTKLAREFGEVRAMAWV
ncbi:MAG: hypothetical protein FJY97_15015 [candidate division Zixibacteria bacterium]|nr:hypothetical protein [candidate division Zixibacteria bacterium]